jgi:serine/threonine-protein kinase
LTGTPPFPADSIERLVAAHLMEPAPRPSQLRPGRVPAALDQVIATGMAKNPEDRYRTAGDLANAALHALTAPEQHQAESILQHGEDAAADETMARPAAAGAGVRGWPAPAAGAGGRGHHPGVSSTGRPAGTHQPDFSPRTPQRRDRRKMWMLIGAAAVLLIAVFGYVVRPQHGGQAAEACGQNVLPFNGLNFRLSPGGVAVDSAGAAYVTNQGMYGRVVKLTPGSDTPTVLPFTGLYQPQAVAVDSAGAVYVTDFNNRVVMLAAGSNNQTVLPFNGLNNPDGVAVDGAGNVYVTDSDNNRVVKLAAGSNEQTVLPFAGISAPWGVVVDGAGNVYVSEHDNNQVLKLPSGSNAPTPLAFNGLNTPLQLALDKDENVYVADRGNDRVLKLIVAGCPG